VQQLREKLADLRVERNTLRDRLHSAIEEAKANVVFPFTQGEKLKEYRGSLQGSRESFAEKLDRLEHRLLTAEITKEEEKSLNNEIMLLKRKLREAESSGNIEYRLEQCEERKEQLDEEITAIKKEKDPIEAEFTRVKEELDRRNEHITGLKGVLPPHSAAASREVGEDGGEGAPRQGV
jgi:chromosome segregation ATPase